jgi:hypothetical protein
MAKWLTTATRLMGVALVPGLALVALPAAAASGLTQRPLARNVNSTSSNWSGYASTSGPFSSVSASWTQPSVTCNQKTAYSSFWVGIDGDGSNTVEQTGSEADCRRGTPVYFAWYEMYPATPVNFSNPVRPGDRFNASVTATTSDVFTLTLNDATEGWTQTEKLSLSSAERFSAEVIAEAPSNGRQVLPLANFGTVQFSSAQVNGQNIGSDNPDEITMASGSTVKAQPSALTSGTNFSVTWEHS